MTDSLEGDGILPFLLERPELRGRVLRSAEAVDSILARHAYPEPVARLLGEFLVLTGLLSSLLKFDGVFSLQTRSSGPVRLMAADITSAGELRGTADFDAAAVDRLANGGTPPVMALLGEGQLAFTVDLGGDRPSQQGIVELAGDSLADCLGHYFRQSEQLPTACRVAVDRAAAGWRAAGLLLQQMPDAPAEPLGSDEEDDWRRAVVLMASCRAEELLDFALPPGDLLYRLFHEERVRVFAPRPIAFGCRCSRQRIETTLKALPEDDLAQMRAEGEAVVTCQFCNTVYRFDERELASLVA